MGGKKIEILDTFHANSRVLYEAFMKSETGCLESYPTLVWPVDSICAIESLRLHDRLFGTDYIGAGRKWAKWMGEHTDGDSGMMVALISKSGQVREGPRGCALSWSLAFMPGFAPDFAASQYARYSRNWYIRVCGFAGFREWYGGKKGVIDTDTGPVLAGIGAAASGFGIAATKVHGDVGKFTELLREAELFSFPIWNARGEKNYFFGKMLLVDVLLLWGKTVRVWDGPLKAELIPSGHEEQGFWAVFSVLVLVLFSLVIFLAVLIVRGWAQLRQGDKKLTRMSKVFVALEVIVIVLWLFWPALSWLYATMLMGLTAVAERWVAILLPKA